MYKLLLIRIKGQLLKINEFQMSFDHIVNSREQAFAAGEAGYHQSIKGGIKYYHRKVQPPT